MEFDAALVVKVMTEHRVGQRKDTAEEARAFDWITERYSILKKTMSFQDAMQVARQEWLQKYIKLCETKPF